MYTNKTPNLELPQWQLDDYLQPIADLNPAFAKLDSSISESNTKLTEALQKVQELTQQVTEDMAAIEQAKKDIQKNATDITDINQVLDGVKLKEAEVDAALKQIGVNVTKLFNNDLNIVRDLTALVDAETTRAKAQEEIIDTKATSAAVAAADAQNLAETSKSFAEEAKNSAAEAAQSASDSAAQATKAQETAESVKQDFETNVRPQVQEAKDAALAAQQSAEAANRQATLSAGYASNAVRDAATATETATSADEKATEALEKATQAQTDAAQAKTDAQTASEQATQAATSASTAETKATEAAESASSAEANAITAAADAESAKQDAASAKADADAAKLSSGASALIAASADDRAGTAVTTSANAIQKAEAVETEFNQLKNTDWPTYKDGIDQSIEQLRGEIPNTETFTEDFVGKTGEQTMEGPLLIHKHNGDSELHIMGADNKFYRIWATQGSFALLDEHRDRVRLSIADPLDDGDAATKKYVDERLITISPIEAQVSVTSDNHVILMAVEKEPKGVFCIVFGSDSTIYVVTNNGIGKIIIVENGSHNTYNVITTSYEGNIYKMLVDGNLPYSKFVSPEYIGFYYHD